MAVGSQPAVAGMVVVGDPNIPHRPEASATEVCRVNDQSAWWYRMDRSVRSAPFTSPVTVVNAFQSHTDAAGMVAPTVNASIPPVAVVSAVYNPIDPSAW